MCYSQSFDWCFSIILWKYLFWRLRIILLRKDYNCFERLVGFNFSTGQNVKYNFKLIWTSSNTSRFCIVWSAQPALVLKWFGSAPNALLLNQSMTLGNENIISRDMLIATMKRLNRDQFVKRKLIESSTIVEKYFPEIQDCIINVSPTFLV